MTETIGWDQFINLLLAIYVLYIQLRNWREDPKQIPFVIGVAGMMLHIIIFYTSLFLDRTHIIDIPWTFTDWSSIRILHMMITWASMEHYRRKMRLAREKELSRRLSQKETS